MPAQNSESTSTDTAFGRLLKFWRSVRRLSQAQLSAKLSTSSRHISFLETGRSRPSRAMIGRLQKELDLQGRDAKVLQLAAGFLPEPEGDAGVKQMSPKLRQQMSWALAKHEPYPAFVASDLGDIVLCNRAWLSLIHRVGRQSEQAEINMYHLFFSEEGMRRVIEDWEDFSCALLLQVKEQQLLTNDSKLNELMEWLEAYPGIPANWPQRGADTRFDSSYDIYVNLHDQRYSLQTIVTGIDPMSLSLTSQLKLHSFFPGDETTQKWWQHASEQESYQALKHPLLYQE